MSLDKYFKLSENERVKQCDELLDKMHEFLTKQNVDGEVIISALPLFVSMMMLSFIRDRKVDVEDFTILIDNLLSILRFELLKATTLNQVFNESNQKPDEQKEDSP